jgi:chemotaxis signal transduction protein
LPPVPPPAQPVAVSPQLEGPPAQERVSYATLASLMLARNQIKRESATHPALRTTQKLLDGLVTDLKEKLLPRTAPASAYPRPAKVLLVESHGMRFALPQSIIREVARIGTAQRHAQLDEGAMISLRGAWLPRVSLAQRLGQPGSANEAYALVLELQQERLVLCVEQVGELEELMLQPLPKLLRPSMIYEAAAILGDGSPCLILNCTALLSQKLSFPTMKAKQKAMQPPQMEESLPAPVPVPQPLPSQPTPGAVTPAPAAPVASTHIPLLMFGDGTSTPKAIPLTAVGRVEQLAAKDVTRDAEGYAIRCRGELLRPHVLPGSAMPVQGDLHLITLLDAPHIGIVAHRVGSIFDAPISLPQTASTQPVLMRAELNGALTDIINAAAYVPRSTQEAAHG